MVLYIHRLIVKHVPLNESEHRLQRYREKQLEPPNEDEELEEIEEHDEPEPQVEQTEQANESQENVDVEAEKKNDDKEKEDGNESDHSEKSRSSRSRSRSHSRSKSRSVSSMFIIHSELSRFIMNTFFYIRNIQVITVKVTLTLWFSLT